MFVNALDPELPSLAADAAIELDLLINGEPAGVGAVHRLGERLRETLGQPQAGQTARGLQVDTEFETVLGQAFIRSGDDPATILRDLFRRTKEISDQLSSAQGGTEPTKLELQRDFCLALSQAAAAYRQLIFDVRPPHPFRR